MHCKHADKQHSVFNIKINFHLHKNAAYVTLLRIVTFKAMAEKD